MCFRAREIAMEAELLYVYEWKSARSCQAGWVWVFEWNRAEGNFLR